MGFYASTTEIPTIKFYYGPGADASLLQDVGFGVEEEGVPLESEERAEGNAVALAFKAAGDSILEVGLGLDNKGMLAVH
jgi:hypothetical protein